MAKYQYDEDLFKDTTMSFGEHLEELRVALFKAVLWLVAGVSIGLLFGHRVVAFIEHPLRKAMYSYYLTRTEQELSEERGFLTPEDRTNVVERRMLVDEYFVEPSELWYRLRQVYGNDLPNLPTRRGNVAPADIKDPRAVALAVAAAGRSNVSSPARQIWRALSPEDRRAVEELGKHEQFSPPLVERLAAVLQGTLQHRDLFLGAEGASDWPSDATPYLNQLERTQDPTEVRRLNRGLLSAAFPGSIEARPPEMVQLRLWRNVENDPRTRISSLSVSEPFMVYLKASLVAGAVFAGPGMFYHLWSFVAAGLYPHEKKYVHIYGPMSLGLFLLGIATTFLFVFQPVLGFLLWYNSWLGLDPDPRINEWLSFVLFLPLGFGISFQLPLVMLFLERIGVFSLENYISKWRIAVMSIFVISAVLTPADPWSMLIMAVPLTFLYGMGLLMIRYFPRASSEE